MPAAILRDAVLRTAPQDEDRGFRIYMHDVIGFMESIYWPLVGASNLGRI